MRSYSVRCCGAQRTGRFCPECGKEIPQSELRGLLDHVRRQALTIATRVSTLQGQLKHDPDRGHAIDQQHYLKCMVRASGRWGGWADALASLLDEEGGQCRCPSCEHWPDCPANR